MRPGVTPASGRFAPQAAAEPVLKVIESAIANARVKADQASERLDEDKLRQVARATEGVEPLDVLIGQIGKDTGH